jgi:Protein of unknown function (DUF2721)
MDVQTAAKTIQLILAPVVMVSACGILLTGMLGHFGTINDRIRRLTAERLELSQLQPAEGHQALARERLTEIDHEVPMLIGRHLLVRHAILLANTAVAILVVSMFVIAAAALGHSSATGTVALFVFLAGTAAVMASAVFMALEVRNSHRAVSYEGMRVVGLPCAWTVSPGGPPRAAGHLDGLRSMALGRATDPDALRS